MTINGRNAMRMLLPAALMAAMPSLAFAVSANTVGDMMNNAASETVLGPGDLLSVATYVVGAALAMWGLIKFKEFADGRGSIADAAFRMGGGALLLALPLVVNTLGNTIFGGFARGTSGSYDPALAGAARGENCTNGLDQCMVALVANIYGPAESLICAACYIVGCFCVAVGIYRLAQAGQAAAGRAPRTSGTVGYMAGGGVLISLGQFMDAIRNSLFGGNIGLNFAFNQLAFNNAGMPTALMDSANNVFIALFAWMQLIGWLAFARGVYPLIKISQGEGQRTHAHAFTHIVGGALAVNLNGIISLIQTTLGISLVGP